MVLKPRAKEGLLSCYQFLVGENSPDEVQAAPAEAEKVERVWAGRANSLGAAHCLTQSDGLGPFTPQVGK